MKNVMAIDPGKNSLGIYVNNQSGEDIALTVKAKKEDSESEIYNSIRKTIEILVKTYNVKIIFCEDYAVSKFGSSISAPILAEIKGLLKSIAYDKELGVDGLILVPIQMWKSIVKHKVLLPKKKNKKYVELINKAFSKKFETVDEADAYLMLLAMFIVFSGAIKTESQQKKMEEMKEFGEIWDQKK